VVGMATPPRHPGQAGVLVVVRDAFAQALRSRGRYSVSGRCELSSRDWASAGSNCAATRPRYVITPTLDEVSLRATLCGRGTFLIDPGADSIRWCVGG
jgi:hypothetical protein